MAEFNPVEVGHVEAHLQNVAEWLLRRVERAYADAQFGNPPASDYAQSGVGVSGAPVRRPSTDPRELAALQAEIEPLRREVERWRARRRAAWDEYAHGFFSR